jgi:hypothetical protein
MERKGFDRTEAEASRTGDGTVALPDEQLETISGGRGGSVHTSEIVVTKLLDKASS